MTSTIFQLFVYIIPLCIFFILWTPPRYRKISLGFSGVFYTIWAGGWAAAFFLGLLVCINWIGMRLLSGKQSNNYRKICLTGNILLEIILLFMAKFLFHRIAIFPLLLCTINCADTLIAVETGKLSSPSLFSLFCYACSFPYCMVGPIYTYQEAESMCQESQPSMTKFSLGVQKYFYGLFMIVLLGVPMLDLYRELRGVSVSLTALDAWLILTVLFFMICILFYGASLFTQGIMAMLGQDPIPAEESRGLLLAIREELWQNIPAAMIWNKRNIRSNSGVKSSNYYILLLLLLCFIGGLFGNGACGILWGFLMTLILIAGQKEQTKERKRVSAVIHWLGKTLIFILLFGFLAFSSISDCATIYKAMFFQNGFLPSAEVIYLCKRYWLPFLISIWIISPLHGSISAWLKKHAMMSALQKILLAIFEIVGFLLCMAAMISMYLRG